MLALAIVVCTAIAPPQTNLAGPDRLRVVVVVSRHGVRSPTSYTDMTRYAARPWPTWNVEPGYLTPHGSLLMTLFGAYYRAFYTNAGLLDKTGCPSADRIYVWTDTDERTQATGDALLDGLAPGCGLRRHGIASGTDPIFHTVPALGNVDPAQAAASLNGTIGADPSAIVPAYHQAFALLDDILGCASSDCTRISALPASVAVNPHTGVATIRGAPDVASTAAENLLLEYADGKPGSDVGWGRVDRQTILDLAALNVLRYSLDFRNPYAARTGGSDLTARILATLDQNASGKKNELTPAGLASRFVAFVGHDTNLQQIGGLLHLSWLAPGYQVNDTPPGSALVFELHDAGPQTTPNVQFFFVAQPLDEMRRATTASTLVPVERVPVYVPGCPALSCPLPTFDAVVNAATDPAYVAASND
jgi:4-phytase/acid phosphatase